MKNLILVSLLLLPFLALGKSTEKTVTLKTHVNTIIFDGKNGYRLELREYAAAYFASEESLNCLQKSLNDNKSVTLTVDPISLLVKNCIVTP